MDTDNLSKETYNAIIVTAEKFHHDLTLQFGIMSYSCSTDNEFIEKSESLIKEWIEKWDLDNLIMNIFFDDLPNKKEFKNVLDKILHNIENVRKIPIEKRKFDF